MLFSYFSIVLTNNYNAILIVAYIFTDYGHVMFNINTSSTYHINLFPSTISIGVRYHDRRALPSNLSWLYVFCTDKTFWIGYQNFQRLIKIICDVGHFYWASVYTWVSTVWLPFDSPNIKLFWYKSFSDSSSPQRFDFCWGESPAVSKWPIDKVHDNSLKDIRDNS